MQAAIGISLTEVVRNKNRYQELSCEIERWILNALEPGHKLPPIRELACTLGVTYYSLQNALRRLELLGLIESRSGSGTVVRDGSAAILTNLLQKVVLHEAHLLSELWDFRLMLEPGLARLGALHATTEDIKKLEEILAREQAKVSGDSTATALDSEFHCAIAGLSRNQIAQDLLNIVINLTQRRPAGLQIQPQFPKCPSKHQQIMAAIKIHQAEAAEALMREHLTELLSACENQRKNTYFTG